MPRWRLRMFLVLAAAVASCASAPAADQRDAAVSEALAASDAAQRAALEALRAAHAALAASGPGERESAVRTALDAAAAARQAAETAQRTVASLRGAPAPTVPAPAPAPAPGADAGPAPGPLSTAEVTGIVRAGQADDTASVALTWSDAALAGAAYASVTFSAPTSSDSDITRLGTLDGLADAASVKLSYSRYFPADPRHPDERFWAAGAAAKVGKKTYRFHDAATFAEGEEKRKPASVSVSAGYVPNSRLMVLARFEAQRKYVAGAENVLCRTGAAGAIACVSGPIGAPVRRTARIYTVGARYLGSGFSLAPSFNYDQATSVRGIDLPVYLVGAGDGKPGPLSGGVGASWRSDTRDTAFYVFVGSPFSFWGL